MQQLEATELVRRFRDLHILVIGDAMLDSYLEGDADRLCSEGPVPVVRKTRELRIPGGAANSAANIRALGAQVDFLGVIGSDLTGTLLRQALRDRGISDQWLIADSSIYTIHKLRILANQQYVVRFDEGDRNAINHFLTEKGGLQTLLSHLNCLYAHCDAVLISDYCYGLFTDAVIDQLQDLLINQPKPVLVDSKALWRFQALPVTVVTPNALEALLLAERMAERMLECTTTGSHEHIDVFEMSELVQVEYVAQQLLSVLNTQYVALTLAERGVFVLDRCQHTLHVPAHPVAHANDVGAGDSLAATMILVLAAGGDIEEAARIGIDAAGIAVTKQYTAAVSQQELLQRVSLRSYASGLQEQDSRQELASLTSQLELARMSGQTIVFTNGVFDILHAGHIQFLRQAKQLGDVLVVGINNDASTRARKGPGRPINSESDRLALVAALDMVDHAILFSEATPSALIRTLRPHIHVKGGDYTEEELPEARTVQAVGGKVVILPLVNNLSTSSMIDRIVSLSVLHE
ncbi:D-glycero-beta-D-manno-heptose 1-phosphate adenylyltransferase [Dictyobacter arantiisoli]|uniref:D-glycero-beta-D-manno-heptose 1-phosphate adenylyltransferase n=1 Tax=Dictyobacter arantiisoli TaxID=2014874 RepID=A0A5A5T7T2_9CHLR|nr:D-glycero-beta-D-manno-heptose 1-phosphate adenylyltransferase [Dictyobacter arantiisoli]GCF07521.1 bifunctional protein HldE [Dictyobacter arantiisoli]